MVLTIDKLLDKVRKEICTKLKCFSSLLIMYTILSLIFCYHEQVDMDATLYLTIVNSRDNKVTVRYVKPQKKEFGDSVYMSGGGKINLDNDSLILEAYENVNDTIKYEFTRADYCYITSSQAKLLRLDLEVYQQDAPMFIAYVFPWDTSATGEYVDNCHKEYWDTLTIE